MLARPQQPLQRRERRRPRARLVSRDGRLRRVGAARQIELSESLRETRPADQSSHVHGGQYTHLDIARLWLALAIRGRLDSPRDDHDRSVQAGTRTAALGPAGKDGRGGPAALRGARGGRAGRLRRQRQRARARATASRSRSPVRSGEPKRRRAARGHARSARHPKTMPTTANNSPKRCRRPACATYRAAEPGPARPPSSGARAVLDKCRKPCRSVGHDGPTRAAAAGFHIRTVMWRADPHPRDGASRHPNCGKRRHMTWLAYPSLAQPRR